MDPWYKATLPRKEVREGRSFNPDEFAIALENVVAGTAPADYRDPAQFFSRTYFTRALTEQVGRVLRRLSGETVEAPPVLSFITQFGGGKTHTLTALYHVADNGPRAASYAGIRELVAAMRLGAIPKARVAVFVGNAWDPRDGRETPWIDLAHQIAGEKGVAALGSAAKTAAPSSDSLRAVFDAAGMPVLVLMDEVLNFLNRHRKMADGFYSFVDNLVRAATGSTNVAAVLSLPKSQIEMSPFEQDWQDRISKVVGRVAKDLISNDEAEVSEVVRRRLFEDLGAETNRKKIVRAYADWCFDHRAELPPEWTQVETSTSEKSARDLLRQRMEACYPFHPSTLSVFQRKWQTLPHYQQTRGTLGMLALWLSRIYPRELQQNSRAPLITLGSAPLDDPDFRAVVLRQVGESRLGAAIDADIAATHSHAAALDADLKGVNRGIHRKVGTAIFFECSGGQTDKAAHQPELRFALASPDIETTTIDTVAAALEGKSFFIRRVGTDGYRIGPKPKLNMVMANRRASLDAVKEVRPACRKLVKSVFEQGAQLPVVAFPDDAAAIPDSPRMSLVIADPDTEWGSPAIRQQIADWTWRRGASARLYPASLIWCLRKPGRDLVHKVETWLAWAKVKKDLADGVLGHDIDPEERRDVDASLRSAESDAKDSVWADYRYIVYADAAEADRLASIDLGAGHSSSNETISGRVLTALKSQSLLNDSVSAGYLLRKWPPALVGSGAWPLSGLRQSFLDGSLTRLLDPDRVLRTRIIEFVAKGDFGLASGARSDDTYQKLWFAEDAEPEEVAFDANVFLLKKETAAALKSATAAKPADPVPPAAPEPRDRPDPTDGAPVPGQPSTTGSVTVSLRGTLPPEQWNRVGTRLIPRLRGTADLRIEISAQGSASAQSGAQLATEIEQALQDLGLQATLRVEVR